MRYNIMRLVNEIMGYQDQIDKLKTAYNDSPQYGEAGSERAEISRELNRLRHAKSLCITYIGNEVVQRAKEGEPLQDIYKLEEWEDIKNLPAGYTTGDERVRKEFAAASKLADRLGIRHEYLIK